MNRDKITLFKKLIECFDIIDRAGHMPGCVNGDVRVIPVDCHSELHRCICDLRTDCTEPDHTERSAVHFIAGKGLLGLFGRLAYIRILCMVFDPLRASDHIARCQHQTGNDKLLDGVCVRARCIKDDNTLLCTALNRNIVHACSGAGNRAKLRRELHFLHIRRAHEYACRLVNGVDQCEPCAELFKSDRTDVIQTKNFSIFHYPLSSVCKTHLIIRTAAATGGLSDNLLKLSTSFTSWLPE